MGTSTAYDAPSSWGPLKGRVTRAAAAPLTQSQAASLVGSFVDQNGGANRIARGAGALGVGLAAATVVRVLAGLATSVADHGLAGTLEEHGLESIEQKTPGQIAIDVLELCAEPGSTLDDVDARSALSQLMEEILADAETPDDVEEVLENYGSGENVVELVTTFFAYYLYEQFSRVFYERLVQKYGEEQVQSFMRDIRDYIVSAVQTLTVETSANDVDWFGDEGLRIATAIHEEVLHIYEVDE